MKLLYTIFFVLFTLLLISGAYIHVQTAGSQFWADILLGGGLLTLFGLFATVLLAGGGKVGEI
ncbi:polyferredoxin [Lewinella marina]|nr:hypothetical protein [Neolewinella marina]NJB84657.1 polyferredoxin [Neolewinella marina]